MRWKRVVRLGAAGIVLVGLGGCVAPAPTTSAYQGKAARTAQDALSQVETARLVAQASGQGRLPQAYLETALSAAENAFSSVQATFDSVQPPDTATADHLRDSLDALLTQGSDALAQLRIFARRRQPAQLAATARSLATVAAGLARFRAAAAA